MKGGGIKDSYVDVSGQVSPCSLYTFDARLPTKYSLRTHFQHDSNYLQCECRQLVYHGVDGACINVHI